MRRERKMLDGFKQVGKKGCVGDQMRGSLEIGSSPQLDLKRDVENGVQVMEICQVRLFGSRPGSCLCFACRL